MGEHDVCHATWLPALAPLWFVLMALAIVGLGRLAERGRAAREGRPPVRGSWVGVAVLVVIMALAGFWMRTLVTGVFVAYELRASQVSLRYAFPETTSDLPVAQIASIAVVRERSWPWNRSGRSSETSRWSLRIQAGDRTYDSCRTGLRDEIVAGARSVAETAHKSLTWSRRCVSGRVVPSTEAAVVADGKTPVEHACDDSP